MVKLYFTKQSVFEEIPTDENLAPGTLVLNYDNWSDYGYYVSFWVTYIRSKSEKYGLGRYRIVYSSDNIDNFNELKISNGKFDDYQLNDNNQLSQNNFLSLAWNQGFYTELYRKCSGGYNEILTSLCDITLKTGAELDQILKANSPDDNKRDIFNNVILREFTGNARAILELQQILIKIDPSLNVGNYLQWENFKNILDKASEEQLNCISELYDNESAYDELEIIVDNIKRVGFDGDAQKEFIVTLLQKSGLDQLATKLKGYIDEDLEKIREAVEVIKEILLYKDTESFDFVHYTTLSTLDILIKKAVKQDEYPVLRLSNARQMNDPKEGMTLLELIGIKANQINNDDYSPSPFFISSMAKVEGDIEDSLPMWKQYGGDTAGISLTYTKECIDALRAKDEIEIYKVCYYDTDDTEYQTSIKPHLELIKDTIKDKKLDSETVLPFIEPIRYLFKEKSYQYENEYRIIVNLEGKVQDIKTEKYGDMKVPKLFTYIKDVPLSYQKVTLGPKADDIDYIAPYIKHVDNNIKVIKSEIPYR